MESTEIAGLVAELVATAADAIVIADADGTIVSWNAGATAMFGYPESEALGASLDLIVPERQRDRHWAGYAQTMATGATRYADRALSVPAIHRDGHRLSIEFRVSLLGTESGRPRAIGAVIRDVTERWQRDRQLAGRLAELEARSGQAPNPEAAV